MTRRVARTRKLMMRGASLAFVCIVIGGCWGKASHRRCKPHIAFYPFAPSESCEFLHMCANEAILSQGQTDKLYGIIRQTPDCDLP